VLEDLAGGVALLRISLKHAIHEVAHLTGKPIRKDIIDLVDALLEGFACGGAPACSTLACERRPTGQKLIEGNAQAPNIRFGAVALAKNDLWGHVVEGATKRPSLAFVELCAPSEVANLWAVFDYEDVVGLQISMDAAFLVKVRHAIDNLAEEPSCLRFSKPLPGVSNQKVHQTTCELQHHVPMRAVLEAGMEAQDVGMA